MLTNKTGITYFINVLYNKNFEILDCRQSCSSCHANLGNDY